MAKKIINNKKPSRCYLGVNSKLYFLTIGLVAVVLVILIFSSNQKIVKQGNSAQQLAQDFNLELNVPPANVGNLDDVSREKIDSLFSNIKE